VTDRAGLEVYAGDAPPVTDDRPRIEYASWVRPHELTLILPKLLDLRKPPPVKASAEEKERIERSYQRLADFYELTLVALRGDRDGWLSRVRAFRQNEEPNAYYAWFFRR
jgi:hypothetical protein